MPTQIGPYRIAREIGRGGMGVVYLGHDRSLDRDVAIKCLPDDLVHDAARLERMGREAKLLASLNHPHIATIHGLEQDAGRTYLILEYLDGESLPEFMTTHRRSWRKCVEVAASIADAIAAAHARGVLHRDIKPDNVRFTGEGRAKLLDFGLACEVASKADNSANVTTVTRQTLPGAVMGTPGYMAPEQALGEPADVRSDIFGFGCLLYEMLTGRAAYGRATVAESLAATLQEDVDPPSRHSEAIPSELDAIVMRCLEKRPDDRFQSARDLSFALRQLLPTGTGATGAKARPGPRASRWRIALAGVALLALAAASVVYFAGRASAPPIASLAILPFVNESGDTDTEFLCEGIAESIINRMDSVGRLRVMSRNASFRHAGREHELEQVADELGVRAIVTGRITRRGENVTISVTVEDLEQQEQVWGERFEGTLDEILDVEMTIVDRIASELSLEVTGGQRSQLATSPTENDDAYLAYIEGRFWQFRGEEKAFRRAIDLFDQAIEIDEAFALAYVGKADVYCSRGISLVAPPGEVRSMALAAARRALEIDDQLAEAHAALGFIYYLWDWDFDLAESELREAIRLKPDLGGLYQKLAHVLASQGRTAEAVKSGEKATRMEPHTLLFNSCLGHFYAWDGQPDSAMRQLRDTLDMDGTFSVARMYLGRELVAQDRPQEGVEQFEYLRQASSMRDNMGDLGWAYAEAGRRDDALAELASFEAIAATQYVPNITFARIHAGLRNDETTIEWLNKAIAAREAVLPLIRNEPHFRHLHGDPRFAEILDRIGLPP